MKGLYYKGEDIGLRLKGSERISLDAMDWDIALVQGQDSVILSKAVAERVEENVYTLWIPAATTEQMRCGKWDVQIRLKNDKTHIAAAINVITLIDSAF